MLNSIAAVLLFGLILKVARSIYNRSRTTALRGPPSRNFLIGLRFLLLRADDPGALYEQWAIEYGSAFQIPDVLGSKHIILCDPKAIAHYFSRDTYTYQQRKDIRMFLEHFVGTGILTAEADDHKRQRKALSPAFSNAAIRDLTHVFFESAYAVKSSWDQLIAHSDPKVGGLIEVQKWMNAITLDSIGMAGFSHDFGCVRGEEPAVATAIESFGGAKPDAFSIMIFLLAPIFPSLFKIPSKRNQLFENLKKNVMGIAEILLEENRKSWEAGYNDTAKEKSIIAALLRAETTDGKLRMSAEEVMGQMVCKSKYRYETTAISLTWALIELARNPEIQERLQAELSSQLSTNDPTWEQLTNGLPYLDAFACEVLRMHPAGIEILRQAVEDDIIPLGTPVQGPDGRTIDKLFISKGTLVRVPIHYMNQSVAFWGPDAKTFNPSRWLDDRVSKLRAAEIQGYRHLLTFVDGTRACIGKNFALTEFKAVISVLVRNYAFALPQGPSTKISQHRSILLRPKVAGEDGARVPLLVRRVE
ncbi:cytochrome P450 [Infundibulicybe gibba]|nr:cytochrome P450 [Infundibulicybe gibba]